MRQMTWRATSAGPYLEVPSPTYLLQQVYDEHDLSLGRDTKILPATSSPT